LHRLIAPALAGAFQFSQLRRREFITLVGGAAALPLSLRAQEIKRMRRIGVLVNYPESDPIGWRNVGVLRQSLEGLGWAAGRNIEIDYRWGANETGQAAAGGTELLRLTPDVVIAIGSPAARALQQATRSVPIVFIAVSEPVSQGIVQTLAKPGANITGFTNLEPSVGGKFLEFLKGIAPRVDRVGVMFNPKTASFLEEFSRSAKQAADKLSVEQFAAEVHTSAEIEATMEKLGRDLNGGLMLPPDTFTAAHRTLIIHLAARYRVPIDTERLGGRQIEDKLKFGGLLDRDIARFRSPVHLQDGGGRARIDHNGQPAEAGHNLAREFESFARKIGHLDRQAGYIAARSRETRDKTGTDWVRRRNNDRYDRCRLLCRNNWCGRVRHNDIDLEPDKLGRNLSQALSASLRPPIVDRDGTILNPTELTQPLDKSGHWLMAEAVPAPKNPIVGSFACCARAASGQVANPAIRATKSRRRITLPSFGYRQFRLPTQAHQNRNLRPAKCENGQFALHQFRTADDRSGSFLHVGPRLGQGLYRQIGLKIDVSSISWKP
jgi:putative tryptophan/tyrosine transport system substrate-binding protein